MNKPAKFSDLPFVLQEHLLWQMDLDYCPYESSKPATIHDIMMSEDYTSGTNKQIIDNVYKAMTDETLKHHATMGRDVLEIQVDTLNKFLKA